jgi:hypothetical protein
MDETIRVMSERQPPKRDEAFWASYWQRLAPRIEATPQEQHPSHAEQPVARQTPWVRRPAFRVSAAAALVLLGILLGKWIWREGHTPRSPSTPMASVPHQDHAVAARPADRAEAYFQKSKVLLLALANFDPATDNTATLNFPTQKRISETLVQEAVYLKSELTDTAEMRLRELVDDLEVVLLQIANIENEHDLEAIEMVRTGVARQALLFRIDVLQLSGKSEDVSPETPAQTKNAPTI